jgi:hypothetical protein
MTASSASPCPGPGGSEGGDGEGPGAVVVGSGRGVCIVGAGLAEGISDAVGCGGPPPGEHAQRLRTETTMNVRIIVCGMTCLLGGLQIAVVNAIPFQGCSFGIRINDSPVQFSAGRRFWAS